MPGDESGFRVCSPGTVIAPRHVSVGEPHNGEQMRAPSPTELSSTTHDRSVRLSASKSILLEISGYAGLPRFRRVLRLMPSFLVRPFVAHLEKTLSADLLEPRMLAPRRHRRPGK